MNAHASENESRPDKSVPFRQWWYANVPPGTVISDPEWWAKRIAPFFHMTLSTDVAAPKEAGVLVPREPTEAMIDAALDLQGDDARRARAPALMSALRKIYLAMLAAANPPGDQREAAPQADQQVASLVEGDVMRKAVKLAVIEAEHHLRKYRPHVYDALIAALASETSSGDQRQEGVLAEGNFLDVFTASPPPEAEDGAK